MQRKPFSCIFPVLLVQIADKQDISGLMGSCLLSQPGMISASSASWRMSLAGCSCWHVTVEQCPWPGESGACVTPHRGHRAILWHLGSAGPLPCVASFLAFSREGVMLQQQILTKTELQGWEQNASVLFLAWKACEMPVWGWLHQPHAMNQPCLSRLFPLSPSLALHRNWTVADNDLAGFSVLLQHQRWRDWPSVCANIAGRPWQSWRSPASSLKLLLGLAESPGGWQAMLLVELQRWEIKSTEISPNPESSTQLAEMQKSLTFVFQPLGGEYCWSPNLWWELTFQACPNATKQWNTDLCQALSFLPGRAKNAKTNGYSLRCK